MLTLKKPENDVNELVKSKCLESMPRLEIENLLSPYMPQVKALSDAMESSTRVIENLQKEANELRLEVKRNEKMIQEQRISLDFMQSILDRRSVKLILSLIDNYYAVLRGKAKRS